MRWLLLPAIALAASCAPRAALGVPENATFLGQVTAYRGFFESEKDCVERLREVAARRGATHIDGIMHSDYIPSGVSYHIPNPTYDGCTGAAYIAQAPKKRSQSRR